MLTYYIEGLGEINVHAPLILQFLCTLPQNGGVARDLRRIIRDNSGVFFSYFSINTCYRYSLELPQ